MRAIRPNPRHEVTELLDRPDFVVGVAESDEDRPIREGRRQDVRVQAPVAIHRELDDLEPELLELLQRMEHGVVLDGGRDDLVALRLACPGRSLEREVEGLGAPAREHDLPRIRTEPGGDAFVRLVERCPRPAPPGMGRAGVPELLAQVRQHRVQGLVAQRRRRGVVQVDRHFGDCRPGALRARLGEGTEQAR